MMRPVRDMAKIAGAARRGCDAVPTAAGFSPRVGGNDGTSRGDACHAGALAIGIPSLRDKSAASPRREWVRRLLKLPQQTSRPDLCPGRNDGMSSAADESGEYASKLPF
jgi:hypothetical protein